MTVTTTQAMDTLAGAGQSGPEAPGSVSDAARRRPQRPTRRVLIVSPQFPPINAPDMQRVRVSLPHYREFGWEAHVLAVEPAAQQPIEPLLIDTLPSDVPVERVRSISPALARLAGVGNIALRALPYLHAAGSRTIGSKNIDLVLFSTTMFTAMPLGRIWKARHGTPYVLDIQDPWATDYYETHPGATPPAKYGIMRRVHRVLEPWTMARVDGVLSVSADYVTELKGRYPRVRSVPCETLPFAASTQDFALLERRPQANRHFTAGDGIRHGVFAGAAGDRLAPALRVLLAALARGCQEQPSAFARLMLHFVGTDYAADARARKSVEPIAAAYGVADRVREETAWAPYFEALQLIRDADFLLIVGSDDPAYVPSKICPYLLAGRPIVAIVHEASPLARLLRDAGAEVVVTFKPGQSVDADAAGELIRQWSRLLQRPSAAPSRRIVPSAREMTARQCAFFDRVIDQHLA